MRLSSGNRGARRGLWIGSFRKIKVLPVFLLVVVVLTQITGCSGLFFVPDKRLILTPARAGLDYQEVSVETDDGLMLNGWLLPGKPPVKGIVVFLHGNAQNISYHLASVRWLPAEHYNVFLYDYRGFGHSQGRATIANSIDDFAAVMRRLQQIIPAQAQRYVIFGQSLGAAIAIASVAKYKGQFPIYAVVADSAFAGFRRIAREKLREVTLTRPFSNLLAHAFPVEPDLLQAVAAVSPIPLLLLHGADDQIVPPHHSSLLFAAAKPPKQFWLEPGAKHILALTHPALRRRFLLYLDSVVMR